MTARKDVNVPGATAEADGSGSAGKVTVIMNIESLVRGFHEALERLRVAQATEKVDAGRLCIPFFEMANWFHSLNEQGVKHLGSSDHAKALLFARNRTHHHLASPFYLDLGSATWRWQPSDVLPLPPDSKHQDAKRQRAYDRVAAGQPLADFLDDFLVQIAKSVRRP